MPGGGGASSIMESAIAESRRRRLREAEAAGEYQSSMASTLSYLRLIGLKKTNRKQFDEIVKRDVIVVPSNEGPSSAKPVVIPSVSAGSGANVEKAATLTSPRDVGFAPLFSRGQLVTSAFGEIASSRAYASGQELFDRFLASPSTEFARKAGVDVAPTDPNDKLVTMSADTGFILDTHLTWADSQCSWIEGAVFIIAHPYVIAIVRLLKTDPAFAIITKGAPVKSLITSKLQVASDVAGYGLSLEVHAFDITANVAVDPEPMFTSSTRSPIAGQTQRLLIDHFGSTVYEHFKKVPDEVNVAERYFLSKGSRFFDNLTVKEVKK